MSNTKYELKSEQAQELMKKMPHRMVARGNIIILLLLSVGLLALNRIQLTQYRSYQVVVNHVQRRPGEVDLVGLALHDRTLPVALSGTLLSLPGKAPDGSVEAVPFRIREVQKMDSLDYTLLIVPDDRQQAAGYSWDSGQVCAAKVNTGHRTILSMIWQHIRQ